MPSARRSKHGPFRRTALFASLCLLASCGTAAYVADYTVSRTALAGSAGLSDADLGDLRSGRIDLVEARYDQIPPDRMTTPQMNLYCDVLLKLRDFARANECLDRLEHRVGATEAVTGKRALVALALGNPQQAERLTASGTDTGSRYVHALAAARLGQTDDARTQADRFAKQYKPELVYYGASLYSAIGDNAATLRVLEDPERRLLRDYGITPNQTAFGQGQQAPFRLDVFDDFGLGLLGNFSYAPAANVYVEYLAAHSLLELGRTQDAIARLDRLLAYPATPAYRDVYWLVLYDRGRAARKLGQQQQARQYFDNSIGEIESMRRSVNSDEGRIGFAAGTQDVYAEMVDLLRDMGQYDQALTYSERARSRAFVDLLASRNNIVPKEMSGQDAQDLLRSLSRAEGREELASAAPDPAGATRAATSNAIRQRIAARAPSLAPIITVDPVTVQQIRSTLQPNETAIAYYSVGRDWLAFVVTGSEVRVVPLTGIDKGAVLNFVRAVVNQQPDTQAQAQNMYAALVRPVEPLIRGQQILFVPYGILHYVPFAALNDGRGWLIERYAIRQVPSLSANVVAKSDTAVGSGSLVLGNPLRNGDAPPLPNAEKEAVEVGHLLPASTVLLGPQATLDQFRAQAPGKAYIHIASHGEFDSRAPLQSRLLLAADPGDNGDLTVGGLYTMRLETRLVTMSACQTAVSLVSDGDDLIGLTRGFLFAGAQNVIATLWSVSDEATGELIDHFYVNLNRTHSVPEALRQAQLDTMRAHPAPYFWAAFTPISFVPNL